MTHRQRDVVLAVDTPRDKCNGPTRHQLFDEDDATTPYPLGLAPHIESKVDLFEVPVAGDRRPENSRVEKLEADDAHKAVPGPRIELTSCRHAPRENRRIDLVVEHGEIAPLG